MIRASIDGYSVEVAEGTTIFAAAQQVGVRIPGLCYLNREGEKIPCDLCRVEIDGQADTVRACRSELREGMVIHTRSDALSVHRRQALTRILSDHYADCEAPCRKACPGEVDIQAYLYHIARGELAEAVRIVKQRLPMPLSIGRICPAFCETACRRALVDEPIAIRQTKRHAADYELTADIPYVPEKAPASGKRVAIVGAGPGGLSAGFYLTAAGHQADLFEMMPEPGGWLRYGIPEFRLPKAVLDKEIELMSLNGMQIHCNRKLGRDFTLQQLSDEYDAVLLAIGASKAVAVDYPGSSLPGCHLGVEFLTAVALGKAPPCGRRVAVIGGGNTAIDCARTALRLGSEVTLIYRRSRDEMPAEAYEVDAAEAEGVRLLLMTAPVANRAGADGALAEVELETMRLGAPDASGRRRPEPTGERFVEPFDTLIAAVSQEPDVACFEAAENQPDGFRIPLSRWNTAEADGWSQYLGRGRLFAIGDFRRGPASAIEAIGDGRKAAIAIDYLFADNLEALPRSPFNARKERSLSEVARAQYAGVVPEPRASMPELEEAERVAGFAEVELGFPAAEAEREARRCMECGCQVNTQCALRNLATEYGVEEEALFGPDRQKFAIDRSAPFIVYDANRCISCGRCVDICQNEAVHQAINFSRDGSHTRVTFGSGQPMGASACVQCGNCVDDCPVGALVDSRDCGHNRPEPLVERDTLCTYCGVGCRISAHVDPRRNQIRYITGFKESPVNQGMLCVKGRYGFDFIGSEQRLTRPLVRKNGTLVPVSWEEALDTVARRFGAIKQSFGPRALAGFSSAKTTNEDNFAFQKFVRRVLGSNNVDHCARLCHASTVVGLRGALGSGAMTNDIPSIQDSDLIFIIGSDTTAAHPIIESHLKQQIVSGKARLIVADPKRIRMADLAELYVAQRPGTDVMLLNGLMREIILNGWEDKAYIEARCEGFDALKQEVLQEKYSAERVEQVTGVRAEDVRAMAQMIGRARRTAIYYSMGITQHTTGRDNVWSIANLQMLCGNVGVSGGGINPLRGQSNVQGSCDMGALPTSYPGYQALDDAQVRTRFAEVWGCTAEELDDQPGLTITEVIDGMIAGSVKALYVMGENPVLSDPDQYHVVEGLNAVDFLVVQDIFLTETAQFADVVLPAYAFAEKSGHFTNTERRVQRLNPIVQAPGEAREDWRIVQDLANAMGCDWHYTSVRDITDEINQLVPQYAGITWARVGLAGLQWPCPDIHHPGTPILHTETFSRGKGLMAAIEFKYAAELPDAEYPLVLTTGRLLEQFHTGTMSRKTKGLDQLAGPRVSIAVQDAEARGIGNGDPVRVTTRRGAIETYAFVTKRMQPGVLFVPFHFEEAPANRLTNAAIDPFAKIPEYKVCAARLEKLDRAPEAEHVIPRRRLFSLEEDQEH